MLEPAGDPRRKTEDFRLAEAVNRRCADGSA
jgi:hypothetical protein